MPSDDILPVDLDTNRSAIGIVQTDNPDSLPARSNRQGADACSVEGFEDPIDLPAVPISNVVITLHIAVRLLHRREDVLVECLRQMATVRR